VSFGIDGSVTLKFGYDDLCGPCDLVEVSECCSAGVWLCSPQQLRACETNNAYVQYSNSCFAYIYEYAVRRLTSRWPHTDQHKHWKRHLAVSQVVFEDEKCSKGVIVGGFICNKIVSVCDLLLFLYRDERKRPYYFRIRFRRWGDESAERLQHQGMTCLTGERIWWNIRAVDRAQKLKTLWWLFGSGKCVDIIARWSLVIL